MLSCVLGKKSVVEIPVPLCSFSLLSLGSEQTRSVVCGGCGSYNGYSHLSVVFEEILKDYKPACHRACIFQD